MPYFDTKYGRENFSYSSLMEFKEAIANRQAEILPKKEHDFFGEVITEIDVKSLTEGTCAFGSEFNTLEIVLKMLEGYENSDSDHSIVDFYNQNYVQKKVLSSRALGSMVGCHASQTSYTSLENRLCLRVEKYKKLLEQYGDRSHAELVLLEHEVRNVILMAMATEIAQAKSKIDNAVALNNTSIAAGICNMLLLEGKDGFAKLQNFSDRITDQINETSEQVEETIKQLLVYGETQFVEEIEVETE